VSEPPRLPRDEELEELGDEVILAQESAVHLPQPRANIEVTTDHPTVVINEPEARPVSYSDTVRKPRRGSTEKTVVIRDRRQIEQTRKAISERQALKQKAPLVERKTLYLLVAAALASLAVGTLVAALVDSQKDSGLPLAGSGSAAAPQPPSSNRPQAAPLDTIDLDSLPVDRRKSRKRAP